MTDRDVDGAGERASEVEGKLRRFRRVLMSYIDFNEAANAAALVLSNKLYEKDPPQNRIMRRALHCAAVVAYCRPFSGNQGDVPDLAGRFLRVLSPREVEIHEAALKLRNEALAHSDNTAWQIEPVVLRFPGGREMLAPVHNDVHESFSEPVMDEFGAMCGKLRDAAFDERLKSEIELKEFLPLQVVDARELADAARAMGHIREAARIEQGLEPEPPSAPQARGGGHGETSSPPRTRETRRER